MFWTILLNVLTLIILIVLFFKLNKLQTIYDAFDSLIDKFIESNQTFYREQHKITEKLIESLSREQKLTVNANTMKQMFTALERTNVRILENINTLKTVSDMINRNNGSYRDNNNSMKSRITELSSTIKKIK